MVEINWTNEAEIWLKDIHDYIALDVLGVFHGALEIERYL
jgi:hypothetical protein